MIPRCAVKPEEVEAAVRKLERDFAPDVVRIRYSIGEDWSDNPAIYFRVLLTNAAAKPPRLYKVAERLRDTIRAQIDPYHSWGLVHYVNFRSESEQAELREASWK